MISEEHEYGFVLVGSTRTLDLDAGTAEQYIRWLAALRRRVAKIDFDIDAIMQVALTKM